MYIALRSFKVPAEGGGTRMVQPGDPIPEVATWKDPAKYIQRGWISNANGIPHDGRHFKSGRVTPPPPEPPPPPPEPDTEPERTPLELLEAMNKPDVQHIAKAMGLATTGTKLELVEAILDAEK